MSGTDDVVQFQRSRIGDRDCMAGPGCKTVKSRSASCVILASTHSLAPKLELSPSMSRPFVLSLLAAALAASGGDAFAVDSRPASSSVTITTTSTLFAENNNVAEEQPTRRDVFRTLAAGMMTAAIPSAASANIVVDTDEFGQEVEYDDEEQSGDKSEKGEKK